VYARLLSWFLDSPAAPFGVHRMTLAGKAQGKDVGMCFGPSAAAGAVRWVSFLLFYSSFFLPLPETCVSYPRFVDLALSRRTSFITFASLFLPHSPLRRPLPCRPHH
jgi:hypothetical protein